MSLALPVHRFSGLTGDDRGFNNRSLLGYKARSQNVIPHGQSSSYNQRHRHYLVKRLCCTVQPLQEVTQNKQEVTQYKSRKIARGLEDLTSKGNGMLGASEWMALPDIWKTAAEKFGDKVALIDPHHRPYTTMTYTQLRREIIEFAEGLRVEGVLPDEKVALFADNSCRWLVADQGIMAAGAVDAVRGTRSSVEELVHIYKHSDSVALVVDNEDLLGKLGPHFERSMNVKFIVLLWGEIRSPLQGVKGVKVYTYGDLVLKGRESRALLANATSSDAVSTQCEYIQLRDVATLVYTSGTTGNPKGVMLTHANLLHQVQHLGKIVDLKPGDTFVSLLPPWHMYERSCEYFSLCQGIQQVYTNVKSLKEDLKKFSPDYIVAVPLVFEILHSGVQKQLLSGSSARKFIAFTLIRASMMYKEWKRIYEGNVLAQAKTTTSTIAALCKWVFARIMATLLFPVHFLARLLIYRKIHAAVGIKKAGISGGGSLAPHVELFFEAIDITIINGYGLTESSPVVAARTPVNNILRTVGKPLEETEIKVVDLESGETLPPGTKGLIKARGPQIMKGYYKNTPATAEVLDKDGWLNTGDLGWIVPNNTCGPSRACSGCLVLDGRAKDTIVLSTGENVDPTQIEEAALESRYIQQIIVVGQDQRRLGALIVPNKEELQASSIASSDFESFIRRELTKYTSKCPVSIGPVALILDPFTIESGLLTPTMKMRRSIIVERYSDQIEDLFHKTR